MWPVPDNLMTVREPSRYSSRFPVCFPVFASQRGERAEASTKVNNAARARLCIEAAVRPSGLRSRCLEIVDIEIADLRLRNSEFGGNRAEFVLVEGIGLFADPPHIHDPGPPGASPSRWTTLS